MTTSPMWRLGGPLSLRLCSQCGPREASQRKGGPRPLPRAEPHLRPGARLTSLLCVNHRHLYLPVIGASCTGLENLFISAPIRQKLGWILLEKCLFS